MAPVRQDLVPLLLAPHRKMGSCRLLLATMTPFLGFGFLENVYVAALILELRRRGHSVAREVLVPVLYDGVVIARYRMDLIVDDCVVIEVKSTELLNPNDQRQLLNYLRATPLEVGLLLHFGPRPKVHRVASPNESDAQ